MTSPNQVNRPTFPIPSATPIADNFSNSCLSTTTPPLLSSASRCSLPSPTMSRDHERRLLTPRHGRKFSSLSSQGASFVLSSSRLDFLIERACHNLRQHSIVHHNQTVLQHSAPL